MACNGKQHHIFPILIKYFINTSYSNLILDLGSHKLMFHVPDSQQNVRNMFAAAGYLYSINHFGFRVCFTQEFNSTAIAQCVEHEGNPSLARNLTPVMLKERGEKSLEESMTMGNC